MTSGRKGTRGICQCGEPTHARGLCKKCYVQALRRGELNIVQPHAALVQRTAQVGRRLRDGRSKHYLYKTWCQMIDRCYNPNANGYHHYGGRGITVCARWRFDFWLFVEDMPARPLGKTLERKNVNGNYCPENCEWADAKTQANNKRKKVRA
jgi:hypothetical protein